MLSLQERKAIRHAVRTVLKNYDSSPPQRQIANELLVSLIEVKLLWLAKSLCITLNQRDRNERPD